MIFNAISLQKSCFVAVWKDSVVLLYHISHWTIHISSWFIIWLVNFSKFQWFHSQSYWTNFDEKIHVRVYWKKIGHVARHTSTPADGSKWQPKTPQEQLFRLVQFLQIRANERHFIAPKIALPCSCSLQFQLAFHVFRHMTALGDASLRIVRMVQIKIVKEIKRYSSAVGGRVCLW